MRDEFLEPMPTAQPDATLLFGKTPVACSIIAVTDEGFCVGVPGIERYEGDPRLALATEDGVFQVKLVLQEAYLDGFYFWVMLNEHAESPEEEQVQVVSLRKTLSQYAVPAIVAAMLVICLGIPAISDRNPLFSLAAAGREYFGLGVKPATVDVVITPKTEAEQIAVVTSPAKKQNSERHNDRRRTSSLISPASMSLSSEVIENSDEDLEYDATNGLRSTEKHHRSSHQYQATKRNELNLKMLLEAGQVGRIQVITKSLVPWLFGAGLTENQFSIRMSDAAFHDLQQFELGLRGLGKKASSEAIVSLRATLASANSNLSRAKRVPVMPEVLVVASDDANIYFQIVRGRMEIVRVLPIDFNKDEKL
jgi:hypothetical protein